MTDTVTQLLDAAEARIRGGGFHAMSFRDLADDLGIKSASVHYHFRHKADLGVALVQRYAKGFFDMLDTVADDADAATRLAAMTAAYRASLADANRACLCGVLSGEVFGLPDALAGEVRAFLTDNVDWLARAMPRDKAALAVSALQGTMLLAVNMGDPGVFDGAAAELARSLV